MRDPCAAAAAGAAPGAPPAPGAGCGARGAGRDSPLRGNRPWEPEQLRGAAEPSAEHSCLCLLRADGVLCSGRRESSLIHHTATETDPQLSDVVGTTLGSVNLESDCERGI
ncbi:uncharacterized protein GJ701_000240 [Geothlypis trichas]